MEKIKIAITGRVASVVALPEVVADNAEYEVDFAFDPREGWDVTLPITALFVRRDGSYTPRIMDAGKTSCTMPPQTGTNIVFVGLTQDDMRTTTPATIKVQRSIRTVAHDPLPAPSEDVYAQILAAYAGIKILSGKGAPTSATQGAVNQLYRDEDTQKLYICTATDGGYTWAAVSGGGSVDVDATLTKAGYAADAKAAGDALAKKIDAPQTATVGEVLTVEEVDAEGKPTKWVTAPAAAEQKQADWAQNDETAADYVKNRPGGYITTQNSVITFDSYDYKVIYIPAINPNEPFIIQVDGNPKTINFAFVMETLYEYIDETSGVIYSLYIDGASFGYMLLAIGTGEGKHSIKITECIPHKFQDIFMPQSATQNIHFIKGADDTLTEDELKKIRGMESSIQVTKKYEGERNLVYANLQGNLFVPGRFITTSYKYISIDSSLETQTIDDFIDTYGWIKLDIFDVNGYDSYTTMMYVGAGTKNIDGKIYYLCAQTTAYINEHLFAFEVYRYSYDMKKLHSTLTIKRIL